MKDKINDKIKNYQKEKIVKLKKMQDADGAWRFPCENGPMTDAYMIITLRATDSKDENLINMLAKRLLRTREQNGAWKLYKDEENGNLSATIEAYTALLFSGTKELNEIMKRETEQFILEQGGLENAHVSTKFMLALNDLYPWPKIFPIPMTILLIPEGFPGSFHEMTSYVRTHFAPMLIAAKKRFSLRTNWTPNLDHLIQDGKKLQRLQRMRQRIPTFFQRALTSVFPKKVERKCFKRAERYLTDQIESDGLLGSYSSATFYMIYAFLALGYGRNSVMVRRALKGLGNQGTEINGVVHIQNARSSIWDTALLVHALHTTSTNLEIDFLAKKACQFLMQHRCEGEYYSTWGFSENNSNSPDVDDTQVVLRALYPYITHNKQVNQAWKIGVSWLFKMQNDDGGWSSFEKNKGKSILGRMPIENFNDTVIDPSTPDITGRVLEFIALYMEVNLDISESVHKSVHFLKRTQEKDGSWYGRWGVCYIYGTWAAVTGMLASGVPRDDPVIKKAADWLVSVQNEDGGWGESCLSDIKGRYVPLGESTPSQTAWAVDTLVSIFDRPCEPMDRGIDFLVGEKGDRKYPTGGGLPGSFYLHYHSYEIIWPLLTVGHYLNKFSGYIED